MSTSPARRVPSDPSSRTAGARRTGSDPGAGRPGSSPEASAPRAPAGVGAPGPPPPPVRTLRADDPSELLAEARVTLGCVPRDCLVMIGHSARRLSPLATRVALRDVGEGDGGVDVPRHLALMARAGCDGAFVLVLAGDGFEQVEQSRIDDACRIALEVVRAAALCGDGGFDVPEAWVLAGGQADSLALVPEDDGMLCLRFHQQEDPLTPPRETLVGMQEVHAGRMVPEDDPEGEAALREVGDALRDAEPGAWAQRAHPGALELAARWHALPGALRRARRDGAAGDSMTLCEPLEEMRDLLSAPDAALHLLHVLTGLAESEDAAGTEGLVRLVALLAEDPALRPPPRVCAGGQWYRVLQEMRMACEGTGRESMGRASAAAWTALGTALAVLAWWNHRFATADDLAQEIEMRAQDEVLALFLLQLARARVRPAWRPATA